MDPSAITFSTSKTTPFSGIQPTTPTFEPSLSSPETPSADLATPAQSQSSKRESGKLVMEIEHASEDADESVGLGYGDVRSQKGKQRDLGRDEEIINIAIGSSSSGQISPVIPSSRRSTIDEGTNESSEELLDDERLRRMEEKLSGFQIEKDSAGAEGKHELLGMVRSLLIPMKEHLPFMRSQIAAQKETILTLQRQSIISEQLMKVERERHAAERDSWRAETKALLKVRDEEIASGARPKKLLDLDVGYHQELEAANKRLEMDNRLMAPRLADASQQVDKLVNELRYLRPYVIMPTAPIAEPHGPEQSGQGQPGEPSRRRHAGSPTKMRNQTTMGDARTELLLLAARKLRTLRQQDDHVGLVTLDELKRGGVVGPDGGVGYVEGYGGLMLDADDAEDELSESDDDLAAVDHRRGAGSGSAHKKGKRAAPAVPSTPSRNKAQRPPATTPGGSNFNDLLRAAELADRSTSPTPASRSNTRKRADSIGERPISPKRHRREPPATDWIPRRTGKNANRGPRLASPSGDDYEDSQEDAGLDLLLQASQLDVSHSRSNPQSATAPLPSSSRFEGMLEGPKQPGGRLARLDGALAPAIDLRARTEGQGSNADFSSQQIDPSLLDTAVTATPTNRRRDSDAAQIHTPARRQPVFLEPSADFDEGDGDYDEDDILRSAPPSVLDMAPGAFASPSGATVPGLGKYVHLTSNIPARRMRSPYLKWTVEEDELLARAVALHGEKWDLVSKGVPTRSYHQVRQRWLRKTGAFDKKIGQERTGEDETSPSPGNKSAKKKKAMA
ncbi:hypothetical protein BD324DRAFT_633667 [Kockovaella imperatae]|uniref:Uncharacterized protein n=1 Tax=Kockovaella imperatae TaxID=4999 RepID=A0A1Y1UAG9_9TREE|nr:hypothetical protein BD324DRAFT_633667 [Kockovaella imperatae]ORX35033.1 hypothetical protein BD324DRAFT_633667 [Kockovaella imperatae]